MNGLKSLVSKMYTKTQLSHTAIEAAANNKALGHLLVSSLRENATLIITVEDIARFKQLPTNLWNAIKHDISRKRIRFRLLPDDQWKTLTDAAIEVLVEEPPQQATEPPIRSDIINYSKSSVVKLRSEARRGELGLKNREEFWKHGLLPLIESTGPKNRSIHLVDQYAFHDVDRIIHSKKGNLKESELLNSGLLWLLTKVNSTNKGLPTNIRVSITAGESPETDAEHIAQLMDEFINRIDIGAITIMANVIKGREIQKTPPGFNARRLFINDYAHFQLSHGMRDFSLHRDLTATSGVFVPCCNSELRSAIDNLKKLEQTNWRIQDGRLTKSS